MAVPKSKISKSAKKMRRSHHRLSPKSVSECSNCSNPKLPHRICPHCGFYGGKEIVAAKEAGE